MRLSKKEGNGISIIPSSPPVKEYHLKMIAHTIWPKARLSKANLSPVRRVQKNPIMTPAPALLKGDMVSARAKGNPAFFISIAQLYTPIP